jgi:hypothetical protein
LSFFHRYFMYSFLSLFKSIIKINFILINFTDACIDTSKWFYCSDFPWLPPGTPCLHNLPTVLIQSFLPSRMMQYVTTKGGNFLTGLSVIRNCKSLVREWLRKTAVQISPGPPTILNRPQFLEVNVSVAHACLFLHSLQFIIRCDRNIRCCIALVIERRFN